MENAGKQPQIILFNIIKDFMPTASGSCGAHRESIHLQQGLGIELPQHFDRRQCLRIFIVNKYEGITFQMWKVMVGLDLYVPAS